jgi:hypothetical protein
MKNNISKSIPVLAQVKHAIREKYAWPTGYPLSIVLEDAECLCPACAKQEYRQIAWATIVQDKGGWAAIGAQVEHGESECVCCHCGEVIAEDRSRISPEEYAGQAEESFPDYWAV